MRWKGVISKLGSDAMPSSKALNPKRNDHAWPCSSPYFSRQRGFSPQMADGIPRDSLIQIPTSPTSIDIQYLLSWLFILFGKSYRFVEQTAYCLPSLTPSHPQHKPNLPPGSPNSQNITHRVGYRGCFVSTFQKWQAVFPSPRPMLQHPSLSSPKQSSPEAWYMSLEILVLIPNLGSWLREVSRTFHCSGTRLLTNAL